MKKVYLTTQRLVIRELEPKDIKGHHELMSDKKVMWYLQDIMTCSLKESEENLNFAINAIEQSPRQFYFLQIEEKESKRHIGQIGYTVNEFTPIGTLADIGYFVKQEFWGKGIVAEALKELVRFGFEEGGVCRFSCGCLKENKASERVMQKCGFVKEAELKKAQYHNGELKDRLLYRMLPQEWESLKRNV